MRESRHWLAAILLVAAAVTVRAEAGAVEEPGLAGSVGEAVAVASLGHVVSESLSSTLGTAVSPLLGVGVVTAVGYYRAPEDSRAALPWYNQPWFWGTVIGLIVAVFLKDTLGSAVPFLKKPLDALEVLENGATGLIALPIVLNESLGGLLPALGLGASDANARMPGVIGAAFSPLDIAAMALIVVVGVLAFATVWLTGHAIQVLILVNPFWIFDFVLKLVRLLLFGVIVGSAVVHPALGIAVCLVVLLVAAKLAGWSLRLTIFGTVLSWDLVLFRRGEIARAEDGSVTVPAFSGSGLRGVPARTMGSLTRRADGRLAFSYRRFVVGPTRVIEVPSEGLRVGRSPLAPCLMRAGSDGRTSLTCRLAPRHRKQEEAFATAFGITEIEDAFLERGVAAARAWLDDWWQARRSVPA